MEYQLTKEDHIHEAWREINQILDELEGDADVDRDYTVGMLEAIADSRRS